DTDPDDFNYQLSQGPVPSGASNVKGSLTMMIGAFLASVFLF
ncbi:4257_t:CDS:1, partial [Funneliformis geosporum]